jgi:hypothetical protein
VGSETKRAAKKPAARKTPAKKSTRRAAPTRAPAPSRVGSYFPVRERRAVAAFLGMEVNDPALIAVMAVQESTGLSVFNGELFAIEQQVPSRDGEGVVSEKWVRRPAAGRDGFLRVAERSGVFGGIVGDVVCANDAFDVDWSMVNAAGGPPVVRHRHAPVANVATAREAREYRGPIIGAWAKGWRTDRQQPFFYFAPLKQHGRVWGSPSEGELSWLGAWEYTNAMILKCAMSYVLRILFVITGVLPADELKNDPSIARDILAPGGDTRADRLTDAAEQVRQAVDVSQVLDIPETIPPETDPKVRAKLLDALDAVTSIDPALWTSAKCSMVFAGRSSAELDAIADDIMVTVAARSATAEREAVMPSQERPPDDDMPEPGRQLPIGDEELLEQLRMAQAGAGAATTDKAHSAAMARVDRLRREAERRHLIES